MDTHRYYTLFELSPVGMIVWDAQGRIQDWNPSAERIFGWTCEEACSNDTALFLVPKESQEFVKELFVELLEDKRSVDSVNENITKDGRTITCEWRNIPVTEEDGSCGGFISVVHDISSRRRAEEDMRAAWELAEDAHAEMQIANAQLERSIETANALQSAAEKKSREHSILLSAIPSILIILDSDNNVLEWNQTAERVFGIRHNEVVGKPFADSGICWDWIPVMDCLKQEPLCQGSRRIEDLRFHRTDGSDGTLGITLTAVVDELGAMTGTIFLAADTTRRKQMEVQLAHAQKMESIGNLAAGIAHEINTPIQYIGDNTRFLSECFDGVSEVLAAYGRLLNAAQCGADTEALVAEVEAAIQLADLEYVMEEAPSAIRQSLEGIERVSGIVKAMKEFSHPGPREKTAVDINRAITSTLTVARNECKYVADVVTDLDPALPLIHCLPGDFNQVILNIVVNAAQAIGDFIADKPGAKGTIRVSTVANPEWVEIRIRDTGGGIPESIKSRIFDPFFTTKCVGKGTGQGLAIAHSVIVDKHNGSIDVESEAGIGATFIVRLPIT